MDFFEFLSEKAHIRLNPEQIQAVGCVAGPALVLAGPGSGKTTVVTARTAFLCRVAGVQPSQILTMTFNRAAAQEMEERFERVFGSLVSHKIRFFTIHGFCNRVLYMYERRQGQTFHRIESEENEGGRERILREIYQNINHGRPSEEELETLSSEIGLVKNGMVRDMETIGPTTRNFRLIYKAYEDFKRGHRYIDFDDMLTCAYTILRKCPDILRYYRNRYRYIQVDEGQDLSKIQFEILSLLAGRENPNLFIVADDDQSIYGFRGAAPQYILNFSDRYADCRIFRLEANYRSSRDIVELSSRFIRKNRNRYDKDHHTDNPAVCAPRIVAVKDESEQVDFILRTLRGLEAETPGLTAALIYRNNLSSVVLADALERSGIDFCVRQSRLHFFSHWVVQDVRAMLRFARNQMDAEAFGVIYYKIKRYISRVMIEHANAVPCRESYIDALLDYPSLQPYQQRQLSQLKDEFRLLARLKPRQALDMIESGFRYGEYMQEYCEKTRSSGAAVAGMYDILRCIAGGCSSIDGFLERLDQLEEMFRSGEFAGKRSKLTLTTMHSAKGLEFDCVFLLDLISDEIPGADPAGAGSAGDMALEEERRLFYVGMTRAKKYLYLVHPRRRGDVPEAPSVFVTEAAECLHMHTRPKVDEGMAVHHRKFGDGVVKSVSRQGGSTMLVVVFGDTEHTLDYNLCMSSGLLSFD